MATDGGAMALLGGGSSAPSPPSGRSSPIGGTGSGRAGSLSPAAPGAGTGNEGAGKANSSGSQSGESPADGSAASGASHDGSSAGGSKSPAKSGSARSGDSGGASGTARQAARSSGASKPASGPTASQGSRAATAPGNDFSAALAQWLAATPADGSAAAATADASGAAKSDTAGPGEPSTRRSTPDPASGALTLLEQALAGALAGMQAAATAAATAAPGTAATSTGTDTASTNGAIGTSAKSGAAGLDLLLTRSLTAEGKAGALTSPAPAQPASTAASAPASTAAAGLTAAAQLASAAPSGPQQTSAPSAMTLAAPVGTSAWTDELGTKVTWMAHQGIESASLQLSPEHLGPLQVSISVHDGQASVWFGAAQPDTRTALEQSLPQLRHLFASQGLTLTDAGVSRESPRGQSQQSSGRSAPPVPAVGAVSLERADVRGSSVGGLGLLDTYV